MEIRVKDLMGFSLMALTFFFLNMNYHELPMNLIINYCDMRTYSGCPWHSLYKKNYDYPQSPLINGRYVMRQPSPLSERGWGYVSIK